MSLLQDPRADRGPAGSPPALAPLLSPPDGRRRLFEVLLRHGIRAQARRRNDEPVEELTYKQAAELAGLSRTSVHHYRKEFADRGLLLSGRDAKGASGELRLNPKAAYALGVDFGQLHRTRVVLVDLLGDFVKPGVWPGPLATDDNTNVLPHPEPLSAIDAALDGIRERTGEARGFSWHKLVGVGISLPGPVQGHRLLPTPGGANAWSRRVPAEELSTALGIPQDRFVTSNDAVLSALHEKVSGHEVRNNTIYIKWTAPLRAALVSRGQIHTGEHGFAGELPHGPAMEGVRGFDDLAVKPEPCHICGSPACVHALADLRYLTRVASEGKAAGSAWTASVIEDRVDEGEPEELLPTLRVAAGAIARAVRPWIGAFDPDQMVLGGALGSRIFRHVSRQLTVGIDDPWSARPPIAWRPAQELSQTALYGAASDVLLRRASTHLLGED
jgi:predicted NBD/HSP70 family sugar kinase